MLSLERSAGTGGLSRACDHCRTRKIRCDRQIPCAQCSTIDLPCSFTSAAQRPREHRQRILITAQYERKIDGIEHGLARIEKALDSLSQTHRMTGSQIHTSPMPATSNLTPEETVLDVGVSPGVDVGSSREPRAPTSNTKSSEHAFEGDSSVRAHAAFAGSFARQAIERSSLGEAAPRVRDALSTLHHILTRHRPAKDHDFLDDRIPGLADPRTLGMPPLEIALKLLRELKQELPPTFELICALTSTDYFTDQCRRVYFATEEFTISTFIIVNVGFYFIFQGKTIEENQGGDEDTRATLRDYGNTCKRNIEATLPYLSLLLPARKENVIALVMGASYAVAASEPSLAWMLNSTACQLCISLGYQRSALLPGEDEDAKTKRATLFWIAYILDRALALRLGRPVVLQDHEITLNRTLQHLGEFEPHRETIQSWLAQAEVQGRIYEELYSPAALKGSAEQRVQSARECASILLAERAKLRSRRQRLELTDAHASSEVALALLRSDELVNLSTLTLVYRALPPESLGDAAHSSKILAPECTESAREAIHAHLRHVRSLGTNTDLATTYMHWVVLFCPFIPFIVLFCHSIEQGSLEDIQLIEQFGNSLEPCRKFSRRMENLFQLCQALNNLIRAFVQARTARKHRADTGPEFLTDFSVDKTYTAQQLNIGSVDHARDFVFEMQGQSQAQEPTLISSGLDQDDLQIFDIMNIMDTGDLMNSYNAI